MTQAQAMNKSVGMTVTVTTGWQLAARMVPVLNENCNGDVAQDIDDRL